MVELKQYAGYCFNSFIFHSEDAFLSVKLQVKSKKLQTIVFVIKKNGSACSSFEKSVKNVLDKIFVSHIVPYCPLMVGIIFSAFANSCSSSTISF